MAANKPGRNDPCPCGSGNKYKHCCGRPEVRIKHPRKKEMTFTLDDGEQITRAVRMLDSIPTHDANADQPDISKDQLMTQCLDRIYQKLQVLEVSMFVDIVDRTVQEMEIVPTFTYGELADKMENDGRFELFEKQICSLKGTDPVKLISERL